MHINEGDGVTAGFGDTLIADKPIIMVSAFEGEDSIDQFSFVHMDFLFGSVRPPQRPRATIRPQPSSVVESVGMSLSGCLPFFADPSRIGYAERRTVGGIGSVLGGV